VEQELSTLPKHLSLTPVFSGIRVTRPLALCVCFVDRCLSFYTFSFGWPLCCLFFFDIRILITLLGIFKLFLNSYVKIIKFCLAYMQASFLDLYLEFDDSGQISTKIYDKRDDFNFKIINFPNMCSNIPASPAYGAYI
jgi:hypothetical protein